MSVNVQDEHQDKTKKVSKAIVQSINSLHIESDRLKLTKFSKADVDKNIQHESDPEIMKFIRDPLPPQEIQSKSKAMACDWSGQELDWCLIGLRLKTSNQYVGIVSFRYESIDNDTLEIGWRLHTDFHGFGYATEAAKTFLDFLISELNPHKVVAYCVSENKASSNIMKKLGMEQEACFREYSKLGGKWFDEDVYGLINPNYN